MHSLQKRTADLFTGGLVLLLGVVILWKGGKSLESTWLLGGMAVLATSIQWWKPADRSPSMKNAVSPALWITLMLFIVWTGVSYLRSETSNYGLDEAIRDTSLVMIFLWSAQTCRSNPSDGSDFIMRVIRMLTIVTLIACGVGVAVYLFQPVNRFVGTFFDHRFTTDYWPNAWAEYLLLTWPLIIPGLRSSHSVVRSAAIGFVLGCLLLSFSRGAMLVFAGQCVLWALLLLIPHWRSGRALPSGSLLRRSGLAIFGTVLVALAVFTVANALRVRTYEVESILRKATFTAAEGVSSVSERREFWEQATRLSLERPLFGWGPYSFRFVQPRLQTSVFATSDHPHNVFLKLAMERGWPAAVLFAAFLTMILLPALWASIDPERFPEGARAWWRVPMLIALIGVLAHNQIDYNLQFVGIVLPFWLLLSVVHLPGKSRSVNNNSVRVFELMIAIILGIVLIIEGRMLVLSSLGRHAESAGNISEALLWYERARDERFSRDLHLSRASLLIGSGRIVDVQQALDDYAVQNEHDARLWILRGRLAEHQGEKNLAYGEYSNAFVLGKYNYLESLEGLLRLNAQRMDKDEAEMVFHAFGEAILRNTHFIALSENVEVFERVSGLLQRAYPSAASDLRTFTQQVLTHAREEREKASSRAPGMLW